ncbi:MAG: hypothetical protein HY680_04340 [Chloroflexi bacterium]|nr:hypothetical protein [Chloroflexota bacterium]
MPKQFTYRQVTDALERKLGIYFGQGSERNGWYYSQGVKITRITLPHIHHGDIPAGTLHEIRKQTLLSTPQFADLVECPMTGAGYATALQAKGKLPTPNA